MDKPVASAPTGAKEKIEKQARQLAYDVRYKTKQSLRHGTNKPKFTILYRFTTTFTS